MILSGCVPSRRAPRKSSGFFASGWALAWWGIVLYWIAGGFYVFQAVNAIRGRSDSSTGVAAA